MSSLEPLENSGNPASYPTNGTFAELLDWHLNNGTRPGDDPDRRSTRWSDKEFGAAVTGRSPDEDTCRKSSRNWRTEKARPNDLGRIEHVLFGSNPAYEAWRIDLRTAYDRARQVAPLTSSAPIPPRPAHFLGRDADVGAIIGALLTAAGPACVLVQGAPGIGKTSLTRAVGHHPEIVRRFGQANRWFVELDTADTSTALQDAITRAVGGDPARGFPATLERLGRTPGLLILDNLETPWDSKHERSATEAILAELAAVPNLALLASFRGDDVVRGVAWAHVHPVAHLDRPHDTELFCLIANWQRREDPDLPRLVDALGGVPLAIELVAAHAYGQSSLAPLWARWVRKGVELAAHPDFDRGRLTSLPHSIELSLASSRLTPDAYRLFRLLGQLPAGLAEQDRESLLGDEGFDAQGALRRVGLAVDRAGRLDLLPPIRDHAARHYAPNESDAAAWPAHYLELTRRIGGAIGTKAGDGALSRLVPEFANIESAIRVVLKAGRRSEVMAALAGFNRLSLMTSLGSAVLVDLVEACRSDGDVRGEANCIKTLGDIALRRSDQEGARHAFEEALPLYRRADHMLGEANCIFNIGDVALRQSDHEGAGQAFDEALLIYRRVGDVLGEANCIRSLGEIALRRSDYERAGRSYEEALPLYGRVGVVLGEANCIKSLGDIALRRSDYERAGRSYEEALPLYRRFGDVLGEANCIKGLGDIALRQSNHEGARHAFEEALPLYRQVGDVLGEANCIFNIGEIALARSNYEGAERSYEEALLLYRRVGDVLGEANCIRSFEALENG